MTAFASSRLAVNILGSAFDVRTENPAAHAHIQRLWRPFLTDQPQAAAAVVQLGDASTAEQLERFATAVNATALDAAPHFAVHAGVISHGDFAIAMPAVSGAGKSTLTAACLQRGFEYVSDEALCLDYDDGTVTPYPRPIGLSEWSATALGLVGQGTAAVSESLFTAEAFGSARCEGPTRLRHLVILERAAGAAVELRSQPRPTAVTLLLRLSFNHYRRPADAVRVAAEAVANADVWRLRYDAPGSAADLLWRRFVDQPNQQWGRRPTADAKRSK